MTPLQHPEARWAAQTAREGMRLARQIRRGALDSLSKLDRSPVTVGDFSIQALVSQRLERDFPNDGLVGEESAEALRRPEGRDILEAVARSTADLLPGADGDRLCRWIDRGASEPAGRYWTLDPIDGTKGFLRGGQYALCLALIENDAIRLGALGCPELQLPGFDHPGVVVMAEAGGGCWASACDADDWRPLRVSNRAAIREAVLLQSLEREHTNRALASRLRDHLGVSAEPLSLDSAAKYALLAAGAGDALLRIPASEESPYREKIWDIAAGALVVSEAGGRITDIDGRDLEFRASRALERNRGILASNGLIHDAILEGLKRLRSPQRL